MPSPIVPCFTSRKVRVTVPVIENPRETPLYVGLVFYRHIISYT